MYYSIGEVSSILNLSRDMIRYYEKQGAIRASRNSSNNYRSYETMEIFWLLEAVEMKSWGIPISEIAAIREHHFTSTARYLDNAIDSLEKRRSYTSLLEDRLRQIRDYAVFGQINIGNFWVMKIPAMWRCHLVTGRGDDYERITIAKEASRFVFSDDLIPFFDSALTVREHGVDWEMSIEDRYLSALGQTAPKDFTKTPAVHALCTHVDIGEIGSFTADSFHILPDYARSHGYIIPKDACICGYLLGRGFEEGRFRRIVRLYLPIQEQRS